MTIEQEQVADLRCRFRNGDCEAAYFGLLETNSDFLPLLMDAFRAETDTADRSLLLEIIWQRRDPSTIPFLANALNDPEPEVWKQAIDGLVSFKNVEAVQALLAARDRSFERPAEQNDFQQWIDEALEQISGQA